MTSLALIGPGRHGTEIARLFASHGVDLVLYHHRAEKADRAAAAVRAAARGSQVTVAADLHSAVEGQDVIALTTLWNAPQRAVISELADVLPGKVLLDVSNPLDVTPFGVTSAHPTEGSAGMFLAGLLPEGTGHAKAFSNLATANLAVGADAGAVLPYLADSAATSNRIRPLLAATGWVPRLVGDITSSPDIEIGGRFNRATGSRGLRAVLTEDEFARMFGPEVVLT
jgi:predicted dinucleotide-binding enzyme